MSGLTGRMLLDKKPSWNFTCFLSTSNSQLLGREILYLSLIVVPEDFYASHSVPTTQVHPTDVQIQPAENIQGGEPSLAVHWA